MRPSQPDLSTVATSFAAVSDGAYAPPESRPAAPIEIGQRVGRFTIRRRLGEGGMGVVYAAYDPELAREIALKVLRAERGGNASLERRLQREARALAQLAHDNVVRVFDVGSHDGQVFLAMELVDGVTVAEWLAQAPRSWAEVVDVYRAAGRGLAEAHAAGIVHRDVKPGNVMIDRKGRVVVTDFGLARATSSIDVMATGSAESNSNERSADDRLTRDGALVGTPRYMAPEQFVRLDATAQSDQFSFATALYEGVAGQPPFQGTTTDELLAAIRGGRHAAARIPAWLRRVLARALHARPEHRFANMTALLAALDRHRRRRRARFAMVGGALGAVGVAAAVALAAPAPVASSHAVTLPDGWQRVPGNTVSALATVVHGGRLYVFARGLDNSIQINSFTRASGWGTPRSIGGMTDAALAATVCWDGMYLFHKGIDRRVYVTSSFDGADWARWMEVPGGGQTDAALSASCPAMGGHGLRVYMTGLDGHVYENTRSMIARPKQWTGWSGWHEVGDGRMTNASLGSMAADIGRWGGVVLLCKGLDNHSYWKTFRADGDTSSAGTWSAWREIGGTTDVALAGSADMIVAKGITDQAGYVQSYLPASDSWTGWRTLRVGTTNAAYAIVGYFGDSSSLALGYYLFEKGSDDNGIYFQRLPSSRSR